MQKWGAHRFDKLYTKFIQTLELQGYAHVAVDSSGRGISRVAEFFECGPISASLPMIYVATLPSCSNPILGPP